MGKYELDETLGILIMNEAQILMWVYYKYTIILVLELKHYTYILCRKRKMFWRI